MGLTSCNPVGALSFVTTASVSQHLGATIEPLSGKVPTPSPCCSDFLLAGKVCTLCRSRPRSFRMMFQRGSRWHRPLIEGPLRCLEGCAENCGSLGPLPNSKYQNDAKIGRPASCILSRKQLLAPQQTWHMTAPRRGDGEKAFWKSW